MKVIGICVKCHKEVLEGEEYLSNGYHTECWVKEIDEIALCKWCKRELKTTDSNIHIYNAWPKFLDDEYGHGVCHDKFYN